MAAVGVFRKTIGTSYISSNAKASFADALAWSRLSYVASHSVIADVKGPGAPTLTVADKMDATEAPMSPAVVLLTAQHPDYRISVHQIRLQYLSRLLRNSQLEMFIFIVGFIFKYQKF